MRQLRLPVAIAALTLLSQVVWVQAQTEKEAEAAKKTEAQRVSERVSENLRIVPLSVEVVLTRYQGEKKVSSLPYTLAVNANEPGGAGLAQLRMGASTPVPSAMPGGPVQYREIGTNIDCSSRSVSDGFQLRLTVEDTSVYTSTKDTPTPSVEQMPVFRTFRSVNTLVLRDGQTREFSAAADRVSGEVVRIGVTLRVVK